MQIRFTKKHRPYNPGEVAGFPEKDALQLIQKGIAVADAPQKDAKPEQTEEKPSASYETTSFEAPETTEMQPKRRPGRPRKKRD